MAEHRNDAERHDSWCPFFSSLSSHVFCLQFKREKKKEKCGTSAFHVHRFSNRLAFLLFFFLLVYRFIVVTMACLWSLQRWCANLGEKKEEKSGFCIWVFVFKLEWLVFVLFFFSLLSSFYGTSFHLSLLPAHAWTVSLLVFPVLLCCCCYESPSWISFLWSL